MIQVISSMYDYMYICHFLPPTQKTLEYWPVDDTKATEARTRGGRLEKEKEREVGGRE